MLVFKKQILLILAAILFLAHTVANAQSYNVPKNRNNDLEAKLQQMEIQLKNLNQRVTILEYQNQFKPSLPRPNHQQQQQQDILCMLRDTGYSKVFLGSGKVGLEAEASVREACGKEVHQSYCQDTVKCNSPQKDAWINGAFCMLTDTGYSKVFRGEATTLLEAEFKVRKACGSSVHPSYCKANVKCETY